MPLSLDRLALIACSHVRQNAGSHIASARILANAATRELTMHLVTAPRWLCLLVSAGILVVSLSACSHAPSTPPGPTMIGTSAPGMNIKMLQWKEGLTVLFVDDSKGMHSSKGSSSTASPVHT